MILVNSSRKIINISKRAVLPGEEFEADETLMKNPVIKAFIKGGELSEKTNIAAAPAAPSAEDKLPIPDTPDTPEKTDKETSEEDGKKKARLAK